MKTYVGNTPPSSATILGQMPIGGIIQWGSESIPAGWLELNGQSTTQFPELATIFGSNLPDMRGQFARGRDNGAGVDPDEPRAVLSVQADDVGNHGHTASFVGDALANHNHTFTGNALPPHTHTYPVGANAPDYQRAAAGNSSPTANPQTYGKSAGTPTGSISNKSAGTPSGTVTVGDATGVETRPTNVALIFIVKAYMAGTTPVLGMLPANKNYIINPTFSINQRAFAGGALSTGVYGFDRWKAGGASNMTLSGIILTVVSGTAVHIVEDFGYVGEVTVSWEGTSTVNSGNTSPYTYTKTAGDDTLTFSTGTLSEVKLEVGSIATPFEIQDTATELAKCQRYYEQGGGTTHIYSGDVTVGLPYYLPREYLVEKRAPATIVLSGANSVGFGISSGNIGGNDTRGFREDRVATVTTNGAWFFGNWTASAEL